MILVDTSAWVEYDRATASSTDQRLTALIESSADIAVTEPIIMEVVAGARDERREHDLHRLMNSFTLLQFDAGVDFDGATRVYLACRRSGITPHRMVGGMVDCMIAAVAWRHRAEILAADADLERVAGVIGVTVST